MTGTELATRWRERTVRAWVPDLLADRDTVPADEKAIRACERARQAVLAADQRTPTGWEPLARLLLRSEGVASSFIEGVDAPVPAVAVAELDPGLAGSTASWVAANLAVIDLAVEHAHSAAALSLPVLHRWHAALMVDRLDSARVGALRTEQGWIGGTSPLDAALVTPPPADVPRLVDDLLGYLVRTDVDPVAQAAVTHAQFEIIHPYADGNGRLGRVLILWVLARRLGVRVLPPLSARIAADPGGYLAELTTFRLAGAQSWLRWFADTLTSSAGVVSSAMDALAAAQQRWTERLDALGLRADAAARRIAAQLPSHPVLTSAIAAEVVGVSERSARTALAALASAGILAPWTPVETRSTAGRPVQWWYASDVTGLITP